MEGFSEPMGDAGEASQRLLVKEAAHGLLVCTSNAADAIAKVRPATRMVSFGNKAFHTFAEMREFDELGIRQYQGQ
jgi:hypothetical protein